MYSLAKLLGQMPMVNQARMTAQGTAVWAVWSGQGVKALHQTIRDHGGVLAATDGAQALWFFFDKEVYRALARLHVWLRLHPQSMFFEVMPATLLVGYDMSFTLGLAPDLRDQSLMSLGEPEIWLHPRVLEAVTAIPGLDYRSGKTHSGMSVQDWKLFSTDPSYTFDPELGWYFIVKPLGKRLDYAQPWRFFTTRAEALLQRLGHKYIINDSFLILPLDNLRMLRAFCREIILLLRDLKAEGEGSYWPVVMATVPKRGHNFNEDLPRKVALDWQRLTPGLPHLSFRDGLMVGDEFAVVEIGSGLGQGGMDDWCALSLKAGDGERQDEDATQLRLPRTMTAGASRQCFYCGLASHSPETCPVKGLREFLPDVWESLAALPLGDFKLAAQELDNTLAGGQTLAQVLELKDRQGVMARAMVEVAAPFQPRYLRLVWRSRGKDPATAFQNLVPEEGEHFWAAMDHFQSGNGPEAENQLRQATLRYPRGYQPRSLGGLLAMEQGDMPQSMYYFQEAGRLSVGVTQKLAFQMFQGRLYEHMQEFEKALAAYREAEGHFRGWPDARYRQAACMVKMGFVDHALGMIGDLIDKDPHCFNRFMVDPELDRGRGAIQSALADIWRAALVQRQEAVAALENLAVKLAHWFTAETDFGRDARAAVDRLKALAAVDNYVAIRRLLVGCRELDAEIEKRVDAEATRLGKRVEAVYSRLKEIVHEASWFPFPALLRDFNRDFNVCAEQMGWILTQHLKSADSFKRAMTAMADITERMVRLERRLISLRILRDGAFFALLLGRSYIWLQLIALGVSLAMFPITMYLAKAMPGAVGDFITVQKWQLQKGILVVLSCLAMVVAVLRTAVSFEKRKKQFFDAEFLRNQEERQEREKRRRDDFKTRLAARRAEKTAKARGGAAPKVAVAAG